jgi:hypothetical protein
MRGACAAWPRGVAGNQRSARPRLPADADAGSSPVAVVEAEGRRRMAMRACIACSPGESIDRSVTNCCSNLASSDPGEPKIRTLPIIMLGAASDGGVEEPLTCLSLLSSVRVLLLCLCYL